MNLKKLLPYSYLVIIFALFLYSFTQVSLSLVFSRSEFLFNIQSLFQNIGYFQRGFSTSIFLVILLGLFSFYIYFLFLALKNRLDKKFLRNIIILTGVILSFSYIAFSYDLFNYIFDAKIITIYGENPYVKRALDFPGDPMLSFMHWTHRVYPYGPVWLGLTVPLSFVGLGKFALTYFLFKFLATAFYFGSVYLTYKIVGKLNNKFTIFSTVLFALNPLVIIESLVSSHNDIVMIFFALLGIYLYLFKSKVFGVIGVFISAAIKIPTIFLIPPMIFNQLPIKKKLTTERLIWSFVIFSTLSVFAAMIEREIQPWYFLWVLPYIALLKPNKYIISLVVGISFGLLLRYTVFLYAGNWDGILIFVRNGLTILSIGVSLLVGFVWSRKKGYNLPISK